MPTSYYLTGPTASGKTAVGVSFARLIDAEIISLDSMSVYRGMNIGTAKPTLEERAGVPHHLVDVVEPNEEFSVADYAAAANDTVRKIRKRNKRVVFVGGTPLYLKAMLRGIFEGPPADTSLRSKLQAEAESGVNLHARLAVIDPVSAQRLHSNDQRRIIRAIEVFELTGKPISSYQTQFDTPASSARHRVFALQWETSRLNERINKRIELMFEQGFEKEARYMYDNFFCGESETRQTKQTASQALGYRELFDYFRGKCSLDEAVELIKQHTRQFAKRQRTWFRSLAECEPIEITEPFQPEKIAEKIRGMLNTG